VREDERARRREERVTHGAAQCSSNVRL
jgi:hypothetical protein